VLRRLLNKIYRYREDISVKEMLEIIKTNNNAVLLDVRSSQEYKEGHVIGSINIPVYDLEKNATRDIKQRKHNNSLL